MWCSWVSLTGFLQRKLRYQRHSRHHSFQIHDSFNFFCTEISNLISVSLITFNFVSSFPALWVISVQEKNCLCDPNSYLRDRVINVETIFWQGRSVSVKSISVSVCKLNAVSHSLQRRKSAELRVYFSLCLSRPAAAVWVTAVWKVPFSKHFPLHHNNNVQILNTFMHHHFTSTVNFVCGTDSKWLMLVAIVESQRQSCFPKESNSL